MWSVAKQNYTTNAAGYVEILHPGSTKQSDSFVVCLELCTESSTNDYSLHNYFF